MNRWSRVVACAAVSVFLAGCGEETPDGPDAESLRVLAALYGEFAVANRGDGPPNEKEFRAFVGRLAAAEADQTKSAPDSRYGRMWISTRDGQPFVVLYGRKPSLAMTSNQVLAHEKTGAGGRVYVAYAGRRVVEVAADKLESLVAAQ